MFSYVRDLSPDGRDYRLCDPGVKPNAVDQVLHADVPNPRLDFKHDKIHYRV